MIREDGFSFIERDRAIAVDAMCATKYADGRVNLGDALNAALDSGALIWASNHWGAVDLIREARAMIPHADVSSDTRARWCGQADVLLSAYHQRGQ